MECMRFSKKCFLNFAKFIMYLDRTNGNDELINSRHALEIILAKNNTVARVWINDFLVTVKSIQDVYLKEKFKMEPIETAEIIPVIPEVEDLECDVSLVHYLKILNFMQYRLPINCDSSAIECINLLRNAAEKDVVYSSEEYLKCEVE